MKKKKMPPFADLEKLPEDDRIALMGQMASQGKVVGVMIDNDTVKIQRYKAKLAARFPELKVTLQGQFTKGSVFFKVERKQN
jgi:hypothetical protein